MKKKDKSSNMDEDISDETIYELVLGTYEEFLLGYNVQIKSVSNLLHSFKVEK